MENLKAKSFDLRKDTVDIIVAGKGGHIGGDMSVIDTLMSLYFCQMNISPENMDDPNRDRFVLSKGHSVEAYYAVLAAKGFLDLEDIKAHFSKFGSKYIGHPNNKLPGIEMNSGSLGHGLPVCVGMALAGKKDNRDYRVYTVMGDGELAEGSVWEGFMAGHQYKLDNLCAVIDRNRLQISGNTGPFAPSAMIGNPLGSFGPSLKNTRSAANSVLCSARNSSNPLLPHSSSPSNTKITFTGTSIFFLTKYSKAFKCAIKGDLLSALPLA